MRDTLVEGVGDEVVWCFAGLLTVLVLLFTWLYSFRPCPERNAEQSGEVPSLPAEDEVALEGDGPSVEATASCREVRQRGDGFSSAGVEDVPAGAEGAEGEEANPEATRQKRLEFFVQNDSRGGDKGRERESSREPSAELEERSSGDGELCVRLKYLDDTERRVMGRPDESLGEFRRRHFTSELLDRRTVRLIFNGAQLCDDAATLSACGICDECVVHVHVSTPSPTSHAERPLPAEADLNPGALMWPLFATFLAAVWFLRFQYDQLFNASSTVLLLGMSGLFCVGLYGRRSPPPRREVPPVR